MKRNIVLSLLALVGMHPVKSPRDAVSAFHDEAAPASAAVSERGEVAELALQRWA